MAKKGKKGKKNSGNRSQEKKGGNRNQKSNEENQDKIDDGIQNQGKAGGKQRRGKNRKNNGRNPHPKKYRLRNHQGERQELTTDDAIREIEELRHRLKAIGLGLKDVHGDGNCLFRALSDQFYGNQQRHAQIRSEVCSFVEGHREEYEPFLTNVSFEKHLSDMKQNGEYGGNIELFGFANLHLINIKVYQIDGPFPLDIEGDDSNVGAGDESPSVNERQTLHVAYVRVAQHYYSVRNINGPQEGDPGVITTPTKSQKLPPKLPPTPVTSHEENEEDEYEDQDIEADDFQVNERRNEEVPPTEGHLISTTQSNKDETENITIQSNSVNDYSSLTPAVSEQVDSTILNNEDENKLDRIDGGPTNQEIISPSTPEDTSDREKTSIDNSLGNVDNYNVHASAYITPSSSPPRPSSPQCPVESGIPTQNQNVDAATSFPKQKRKSTGNSLEMRKQKSTKTGTN